jgi:hypothetical protein
MSMRLAAPMSPKTFPSPASPARQANSPGLAHRDQHRLSGSKNPPASQHGLLGVFRSWEPRISHVEAKAEWLGVDVPCAGVGSRSCLRALMTTSPSQTSAKIKGRAWQGLQNLPSFAEHSSGDLPSPSHVSSIVPVPPGLIKEAPLPTCLRELRIKDFALIANDTIRFSPGLNVITGESGSGKSVLVRGCMGAWRWMVHTGLGKCMRV